MKLSLYNQILFSFLICLGLILALGALDFISSYRLSAAYRSLENSKDRVILLEETASSMKDLQRAHRGFVVTHDKRFLDPYYHSLELIPSVKARLRTVDGWRDNDVDVTPILVELIDSKQQLTEAALLNGSSPDDSTAREMILEGKTIVDSANFIIERLKQVERRKQNAIEEEVAKWISTNTTVIVTGIVTFTLLLTFGLIHLSRVLRERHRLYVELRDRSTQLASSNEELATLNEELHTSNEHLHQTVRRLETVQTELSIREKELNDAQRITRTGSFRLDIATGAFSYSPSYASILGLKDGEMIRNISEFLEKVHPEDRSALVDRNEEFFNAPDVYIHEFRLLIDGLVKHIKAAGQLISRDGTSFFLGTIADVSELAVVNQQLQEANRKLLESNGDLESFTYSISHDLKAPVRSILMYAHLMKEKGMPRPPEEERWLDVILRKGKHINDLIDGLLALSRWGSMSLQITEVQMGDLVKEALEEIQTGYPRTRVSLATPLGKVHADLRLIRQVWSNLLLNAFKFSDKVAEPEIVIRRKDLPDAVEFAVADNGTGFDASRAQELFTVFKRLHHQEDFGGSGVGLAIVKRIINSHGGEVRAEGAPDYGATFYFTLPKGN